MENEITDAQSDQMLMDGLKAIYEPEAESIQESETAQETPVDRGTQEPEANNGAEEPAKQEPSAVRASNSEPEKQEKQVQKQSESSPDQAKKPSRYEMRIQELVRERDEARKQAAEFQKAQLAKQEPAKPLELVEKPKPPPIPLDPQTGKEFSRAEIQRALENLQDRADSGQATIEDMRNIRHLNGLLQSMDLHQIRLEQWELKNGQEVKSFEEKQANFNRIAEEKMPDLKNPDSPLSKVTGNLNGNIDKWLKGPERKYYVAEIASLLVGKKNYDSELGARNKEIETLKKEIQTLKGKFAPARQVTTASVGESSEEDDPNWLLNRLKEVAPKGFI